MHSGATLEERQRWMRERHAPEVSLAAPAPCFEERHFTVAELASRWSLGPDTIRGLFEREPGVLVIGQCVSSRAKRRYTTLRIPASVAERVYQRMLNVAA